MDQKIKVYDLIKDYIPGTVTIYEIELDNQEIKYVTDRKKIKLSMGFVNENITLVMKGLNLSGGDYDENIVLYQNGILEKEKVFYYYNVEKNITEMKTTFSKEEALNTEISLQKINFIKVIGEDIFETKNKNKFNILNLNLGLNYYFPESVEKIEYIFSWEKKEKSWKTLTYIIITKDNQKVCYENFEKKLFKLEINFPNIEFENVLYISENKNNIIIETKDSIILYYEGKEVLKANKFIQRRGNFYFFEIKNRIKIFYETGEEVKKGFKVISTLSNKLTEKIIILSNTSTHKKVILKFDDKFENFSIEREKFYSLKNDRVFVLRKEGVTNILNLEGKSIEIQYNKKLKGIKYLKLDSLRESNLKIDILEIPYKISRGKFNQHDENTNSIYKEEYTKSYLVDLKERGFGIFYLEELEEGKYDIYREKEKKNYYKNKKIEKIFLEESRYTFVDILLYFYIIYRLEYIKDNKLKIAYETFRQKHHIQFKDRKKDRGILLEYNYIDSKEKLMNIKKLSNEEMIKKEKEEIFKNFDKFINDEKRNLSLKLRLELKDVIDVLKKHFEIILKEEKNLKFLSQTLKKSFTILYLDNLAKKIRNRNKKIPIKQKKDKKLDEQLIIKRKRRIKKIKLLSDSKERFYEVGLNCMNNEVIKQEYLFEKPFFKEQFFKVVINCLKKEMQNILDKKQKEIEKKLQKEYIEYIDSLGNELPEKVIEYLETIIK